jgi:CubicO group peptidase (beta-lactamase class C family)
MRIGSKSFWLGVVAGALAMSLIRLPRVFIGEPAIQQRVALSNRSYPENAACPVAGDEAVTRLLKPIRQKFGVPAISAVVVTSGGVKFAGAVGVRKRGTEIPVTLDDQWHLGSDGKAMTSTLIARLVEQNRLKWDTPLVEYFPELASTMHTDFQKATLLHFLSHRAGLPGGNVRGYAGDDVKALRERAVRTELAKAPTDAPGSHYAYANMGYIIAGAVAERVTGKTWESLMEDELFAPLQMKGVGFGGTGTPGQIDQPWPHTDDGEPTDFNGPTVDNVPILGPAGRIHCTMQAWAAFVADQLRGTSGETSLLTSASYEKLHTPPFGGDYALGWKVLDRNWGGGKVLNHSGDNEMNRANVWMAPQRNFAILVCVNQSGERPFQATDAAVAALIKLYQSSLEAKK